MTRLEAFPAAAVPCRRDMRRRLHSELDAVRSLLSKAEALVALARKDVNGGAAEVEAARRSHSRVRPLRRRGRSDREEFDRARNRRGESDREVFDRVRNRHGQRDREDFDRERNRRGQRDREEFDRARSRRGQRDREEFDRARSRRGHSDCEEFDRARKIRRLQVAEPEPPKIEAGDVAPSPCQVEDGEIAPAVDAPSLCQLEDGEVAPAVDAPSLCQLKEGEIASDQGAGMDIDICGGVSPVAVDKVEFSSLAKQEDDELVHISGDASPVAIEKFSEACRSDSSCSGSSCSDASSSDSDSSGGDDDDDGSVSSNKPDTTGPPIEAAATTPLEQDDELAERTASPATQMSELIARVQEKQRLRRELERKRAREALEELQRTARPISDSIDAMDMKLLGLVEVQYIISPEKSRDSLRRRGGRLQQPGFFLKSEYS